MSTPPALWSASKRTTSAPFEARSAAQVSPEGPLPITATLLPFFLISFGASEFFLSAISAQYLSSAPMATEPPSLAFLMHIASHCFSCGQTLPQMAGRLLVCFMISAAARGSPHLKADMNCGIFTDTGQPFTHCGFLQFRHLCASSIAVLSSKPRATSSKFFILCSTG